MSGLVDREEAFENRFAHDEELMFKARARRDKLFARWLAGELGITAEADVEAYASDMLATDLAEPGDADVLRKARTDADAKGLDISDHMLERRLEEFLVEAQRQLHEEG